MRHSLASFFGTASRSRALFLSAMFICPMMMACGAGPATAAVGVAIDLTSQRMRVTSSSGTYDWPISSARSGYRTPGGTFAAQRLVPMHYSKKYHMSPMPHSIFFAGGYAIHGTYSTSELGRPASHGCVRLSPANAAMLYRMVKAEGARISISGSPPPSRPFANEYASRRARTYARAREEAAPDAGLTPAPAAQTDSFNLFSSDASAF